MDDTTITLILAAAAVTVAIVVAIIAITPRRKPIDASRPIPGRPSYFVFYCGYILLLLSCLTASLFGKLFLPFGIVGEFILWALIFQYIVISRRTVALDIFSSLAASMRLALPLPEALA